MSAGETPAKAAAASESYWASARRQFLSHGINRASLGVIFALFALAAVADFIASDLPIVLELDQHLYVAPNLLRPPALRSYDNQRLLARMSERDWAVFPPVPWGYNTHDLDHVLTAPSAQHWLGTDDSGRDVMSRVVHGSRVSLAVGVLSVVVLIAIGLFVGSVSAYFGGVVELLLMRVVEIIHSVPTLLFLVTMLALIMPSGWWSVIAMMIVIGLVRWTDVARLVRGEILRIKTLEYVQAARVLGMSHARILLQHILPNALSPVLVTATFAMASAILLEGALSFLGFGIPDDMASWGSLLNEVRGHTQAWWLAVFPGAAIFITVTAYNLAGEGLRDAIDPRLRL